MTFHQETGIGQVRAISSHAASPVLHWSDTWLSISNVWCNSICADAHGLTGGLLCEARANLLAPSGGHGKISCVLLALSPALQRVSPARTGHDQLPNHIGHVANSHRGATKENNNN